MEQKAVQLFNRGMNRDISVSKASNEFAFENHNIRIQARDHDTLMSITNERGNKEVENLSFSGVLLGWNVLNSYLILFFHDGTVNEGPDSIYRLHYDSGEFTSLKVFQGNLGFDSKFPIESITDYESEDIMKIYWVDGKNVLRFLNFSDSYLERHLAEGESKLGPDSRFVFSDDPTWFDSNRPASTTLKVEISKDNSGNTRYNGVAQYFITYYNKNGQQTGIIYASPLVYLSPEGRGGAPDETNSNKVTLKVTNVDKTFEYIRLYQIVRTSKDVTNTAFLVSELSVSGDEVTFIDDASHSEPIDITSLLFLGSKDVHAGTLTSKDNTLFLGDLRSVGNADTGRLEQTIKDNAFLPVEEGKTPWESAIVRFEYSSSQKLEDENSNIPYVKAEGYYPYESQLEYPSDKITTFKGGEKYRFALRFYRNDGTYSESFWIGDKVNYLYPKMTENEGIKRAVAVCDIPDAIIEAVGEFTSVQLMVAQANYSDRSVKAQGIINPTLFNLYNRFNDAPYAQASWIFRPRNGEYPNIHLSTLNSSDSEHSEIQNNYWGNVSDAEESETDKGVVYPPSAVYYVDKASGRILDAPVGFPDITGIAIAGVYYRTSGKRGIRYHFNFTVNYYSTLDNEYKLYSSKNYKSSQIGYNTAKELVSKWLEVYDDSNVPVQYRKTSDEIERLLDNLPSSGKVNYPWPEEGWGPKILPTAENTYSADAMYTYYTRQFYFVDENIVTFNSPEVDSEIVNIDRNSGLRFRIVGVARLTGAISDFTMSADDFYYVGSRIAKLNFSSSNISDKVEGLSAWPLYKETSFTEDEEKGDVPNINVNYMMYMWHKAGSIPEATYDDKDVSVLRNKVFANLHFSYYSLYNNYKVNEWSVGNTEKDILDIRQFDALSEQIYSIQTLGNSKNYIANVNEASMVPSSVKYPIYYSEDDVYSGDVLNLKNDKESQDPIPITYRSKPHIVISLPANKQGEIILPYIFSNEKYTREDVDTNTVAGPYAPWKQRIISDSDKHLYRAVDPDDDFTIVSNGSYPVESVSGDFSEGEGVMSAQVKITYSNSSLYKNLISGVKSEGDGKPVFAVLKDVDNQNELYITDISDARIADIKLEFLYYPGRGGNTGKIILKVKTSGIKISSVEYELGIKDEEKTPFTILKEYSGTFVAPEDAEFENEFTIKDIPDFGIPVQSIFGLLVISFKDSSLEPLRTAQYFSKVTGSMPFSSWEYTKDLLFFIKDAEAYKLSELPSESTLSFINLYDKTNITYYSGSNKFSGLTRYIAEGDSMPFQDKYTLESTLLPEGSKYLFLGELYMDYDSMPVEEDSRYGGIGDSAIKNNVFIPAGPKKAISDATPDNGELKLSILGNEGDTFFQRWDCVKTLPRSEDDVNQVVDIASVMLETHINLDGRTDLNRADTHLVNIDWTQFGKLNTVYSQMNNFQMGFDLDDSNNLDTYRSYITWTLEKKPNSDIDEWTHISMATPPLKLDGDKGEVRALRRFNNSILAFQDKGIAEILFNSRTQIAVQEGVPVEIANSGKVDGKRYITNKYGVTNKWSIIEGKSGLFFVDNLNKIIGVFSGEGIESISTKSQLDAWVRDNNSLEEWNPEDDGNIVAFYDKIHSDVYFINSRNKEQPCLVYNEILGGFVGFYDYSEVPMMTNVEDKFISFHRSCRCQNGTLWFQNEGLYCRFFGEDKPFWMTWRVSPDGISDKIWTNIEYRTDFVHALDRDANSILNESELIDGEINSFISNDTFDTVRVWNEYQNTGEVYIPAKRSILQRDLYPDASKRFRIWRMDIPRATKSVTSGNRFGLDRIRNPWVYVKLKKNEGNFGQSMMQLHDIVVKYFSQQ